MAKKVAKKVKKKQKPKQKQKQKQSQRTSVTVNINTKSKTKKAPRATNGNTNRVLQQFAQPIITLPSNLINPPPMPQYGLNPSQLQARRNDGEAVSMGQRLGSDSELRRAMRATAINDEQSLSGFSYGTINPLSDYSEPSKAYTPSLGSSFTLDSTIPSVFSQGSNAMSIPSNFTVDTSDKSSSVAPPSFITRTTQTNLASPVSSDYGGVLGGIYSQPGYATAGRPPAQARRQYTETPDTRVTRDRGFRDGGLSAEPPRDVGIPMSGNPSLKGSSSGMEFLPRRPNSDTGAGTTPMADADTRSYSSY